MASVIVMVMAEFGPGQTHVTTHMAALRQDIPAGARLVGASSRWNHKLELEQMTVTLGNYEEDVIGYGSSVGFEWLASSGWPLPFIRMGSGLMFRVRYADAWPPQRPGVDFGLAIVGVEVRNVEYLAKVKGR